MGVPFVGAVDKRVSFVGFLTNARAFQIRMAKPSGHETRKVHAFIGACRSLSWGCFNSEAYPFVEIGEPTERNMRSLTPQ